MKSYCDANLVVFVRFVVFFSSGDLTNVAHSSLDVFSFSFWMPSCAQYSQNHCSDVLTVFYCFLSQKEFLKQGKLIIYDSMIILMKKREHILVVVKTLSTFIRVTTSIAKP